MSSIFGSITKYAVAGVANDKAYNEIRDVGAEVYDEAVTTQSIVDEFEARCHDGEQEFMRTNHGQDENARHSKGPRKGEWKFRTYLPRAYSTAKSAVLKGLRSGVNPAGLGKSALEKQSRQATVNVKSPEELVREAWNKFFKRLEKLDAADQQIWATTARMELDKL